MEPYTYRRKRGRTIAATIVLVLGLAAVMVVLHPGLKIGLAGNAEYGAILGFGPEPGATLLGLEPDARAMDTGTRGRANSAPAPSEPTSEPTHAQVQPIGSEPTASSGTSDGTGDETPPMMTPEDEIGSYEAVQAVDRLKPAGIEDQGDPIATASGWFSEPRDREAYGSASLGDLQPSEDDEDPCDWSYEIEASDGDKDGNPEWVHVRGLCVIETDENSDGQPEARVAIARDFQAWDNDSNGQFNVLIGKQGLKAFVDDDSDGLHEIEAQAIWDLSVYDEVEDKRPESLRLAFYGEQTFDLNENGTVEYERHLRAFLNYTDASSNGFPEELEAFVAFGHVYDIGDDGTREYRGIAVVGAHTIDATDDGYNESAVLTALAYEELDANLDGTPEGARGISLELSATDATSNGAPEQVCLELYAGAFLDEDSNGVREAIAAAKLEMMATDETDDGHPELVQVTFHALAAVDANEDGFPEEAAIALGQLNVTDADSSGVAESAEATILAAAAVD
ncbi:MAG TPA: hypothetical protein VJN63_02775, partial [Thermoplasmata archaeon]|nr:hypothetical protein [Thermoplasmata archaeon]